MEPTNIGTKQAVHPAKADVRTYTREDGTQRVLYRQTWSEGIGKSDTTYMPVWNVYLHGEGFSTLKLENIRSLEEAQQQLQGIIEDQSNEWTYGIIYECRAVYRYGTQYTHKKPKN